MRCSRRIALSLALSLWALGSAAGQDHGNRPGADFPPPLESYADSHLTSLGEILAHRVEKEPFNVWATAFFACAIVHTFLAHRFRHIAHKLEERHRRLQREGATTHNVSAISRVFHFFGELEVVFGIWAIPLLLSMNLFKGSGTALAYVSNKVSFTEPVFVVVIMAIASSRPILRLAEQVLGLIARIGGGTPTSWWLAILTVGTVFGSFITEPGAMTICALLLSSKIYSLSPSPRFAYGTLGLLFVNVSIGGVLTNFAAPPVLMVAGTWGWTNSFMLTQFGWKAVLSILLSVGLYYSFFRKELADLTEKAKARPPDVAEKPIPLWVTAGHLVFLTFTVVYAHHLPFLILAVLFFLAFTEVTEDFQRDFRLRPAILVGFFLGGLVIHGRLQQWWIAPVLGSLDEFPLMMGAVVLTAFNDNAAITYLCTLVPTFTEGMKYAAVAGAVIGGGLTVIANAPNPAGTSILGKHFTDGVGTSGLILGAIVPTVTAFLVFLLL